jgi:hypothetical protein
MRSLQETNKNRTRTRRAPEEEASWKGFEEQITLATPGK